MKVYFSIVTVLFYSIFMGQEFKIISIKDSIPENKNYEIFEFINDKTPTDSLRFLASISCEGEKKAFSNIYEIAKFHSQNLGSNSFKYIKKEIDGDNIKIFLDVYYTDPKILLKNRNNEPENSIYIFGSDNLNEKKKRSYKQNGTAIVLPFGKFNKINYQLNSTLKLSKDEFMAPFVKIKSSRNFRSLFFNTDGWGQNDSRNYASDVFDRTMIYDRNTLYHFDKNLGYTLLEVLK